MPADSRSKNGIASLAYVAGIHVFAERPQVVDGRNKSGHDGQEQLYSPNSLLSQ